MRLTRAILISVLITLALTLILQSFFGAKAFGLFLILPLAFAFGKRKESSDRHDPIEPK